MFSKFQNTVLDRLRKGDRLVASVSRSDSNSRIGLGVHRFKSDKKHVGIDTLHCLKDAGMICRVEYGDYDQIELTEKGKSQ